MDGSCVIVRASVVYPVAFGRNFLLSSIVFGVSYRLEWFQKELDSKLKLSMNN